MCSTVRGERTFAGSIAPKTQSRATSRTKAARRGNVLSTNRMQHGRFPGIDAALSRARHGSQRAVIRRALAEMAPLGQKTVRGSLNEISQDADEVCPDAVPGSP
jgi:hypothetical protein